MAQNDFGWGSSQWRNRPMSTEIGDHNEPFQYQRPQPRSGPGPVSPWTPGPRSTSTSGLKPLFYQPTPTDPTDQPPSALPPSALPPTASALPPTAPIGQMPSPRWANPPDFNDNPTTEMPAPTEPVRQPTSGSTETTNPKTGMITEAIWDSFPPNRPSVAPVPGWSPPATGSGRVTETPATGRMTESWGPPLPAAQTPPGIARSYPGRGPTIGYPGGPNPGPAVEIPGGVWLEQPSPSSLRDLLRPARQRLSNLRNDRRRISALEAPRNRPWSTEAIGDQGDPSIPAPNLGRPNLFYGEGYPEPMEIDYQRRFDQFRRGGPGNAYGWGGRNFRRF